MIFVARSGPLARVRNQERFASPLRRATRMTARYEAAQRIFRSPTPSTLTMRPKPVNGNRGSGAGATRHYVPMTPGSATPRLRSGERTRDADGSVSSMNVGHILFTRASKGGRLEPAVHRSFTCAVDDVRANVGR